MLLGWVAGVFKVSGSFIKGVFRGFVETVWMQVLERGTQERVFEKVEQLRENMEKLRKEREEKKEEEERKKQVEEEEKRERKKARRRRSGGRWTKPWRGSVSL